MLEVHITKGMRNGQKITFGGEADEAPGVIPGDIIFIVEEKVTASTRPYHCTSLVACASLHNLAFLHSLATFMRKFIPSHFSKSHVRRRLRAVVSALP